MPDRTPPKSKTSSTGFAALGLDEALVASVASLGYEEPTPVQRETIPLLLDGRDLLAQAATGTGKTAAFALPMLHRISALGAEDRRRTNGLVLVPTRELAMQVAEAVHKYARGGRLTVLPLYGGAPMLQQIRALERGANIVVATPGRALDHIRRGTLKLDTLDVLILDEADEMLDMGFAEDLDAILEATPAERQTALFSATMPARILSIARTAPEEPDAPRDRARNHRPPGKLPRVRQVAYIVARAHKPASLERVLDIENPDSALVFCRTRLEVDTLVEMLNAHGHRAEALHGGMEQRQRDRVMGRFREGKADLLVATDVAARGLDIERLSHVINYDVPASPDTYVHRIGRTGRAGRDGTAITLAEPREHRLLRAMEAATKQKIDVAPIPTVADLRARRLEITRAVAARAADRRRPRPHPRRRRGPRQRVRHRRHRGGGRAAGARGGGRRRRRSRDPGAGASVTRRPAVSAAEAGARPSGARPVRARDERRHDPAVRRRRPAGGHPPRRSRRGHHRRSRHRVALDRRHRDQRRLLARRSAGGAGRRRHRGAARDEAPRVEGHGAAGALTEAGPAIGRVC